MSGKFSLKDIPAQDATRFFSCLAEAYQAHLQTKAEIARIEAAREVLITEIEHRYAFYQDLFDRLFAERRDFMSGCFAAIDEGIKSGNKEVVLLAMSKLSELVSNSPFKDFEKISAVLEGRDEIEI